MAGDRVTSAHYAGRAAGVMFTADGVSPPGSRPRLAVELEDDRVACRIVCTQGYADCTVLALQGELDISDRAELSSQLAAVVSGGPWLIVDLTDLTFIDCSSLAVLVNARERARLAGGDVLLAGPRGAVARMLLLSGQAGVFSVFPGVGVAAFSAGLAAIGTRLAPLVRADEANASESSMEVTSGVNAQA